MSDDLDVKRMSHDEFNSFKTYAIEEWAKFAVGGGDSSIEAARVRMRNTFEKMLPDGISSFRHDLWSIYLGSEQIGYLWIEKMDGILFARDFEIYEPWRDQGHGQKVMKMFEKCWRQHYSSFTSARLEVHVHNERAMHLYKKFGFKPYSITMVRDLASK